MSSAGLRAGPADGLPRSRTAIIDTDVHGAPQPRDLAPYLAARWRDYRYGGRGRNTVDIPRLRAFAARTDSYPPRGGPPASDPAYVVKDLLDRWGMAYAINNLIAVGGSGSMPRGHNEAIAHACNEWQAAELLARDPRWRCAINVAYEYPESAATEIELWMHDPRFVQVVVMMRTEKPLGDPKYWPLLEACAENDLPLGIHVAGSGNNTLTGSGWPSYYYEDHTGYIEAVPVHLASLVCEGAFDRFPSLKLVWQEGGWSWLPSLCWRFDAALRVMHDEVPHLERTPSEYIRAHSWFTSQPMEEPENGAWFLDALLAADVVDRLMYSSDYPHWDFDSPEEALPANLPADIRDKIMFRNAQDLYGLTLP